MAISLYEPLAEIARLEELREKGFSDIEAVKEVLAIRREAFVSDVDRCLGIYRYYKARIAEIDALKDSCQSEINRCENWIDKSEEQLRQNMQQFQTQSLEGLTGKFRLRSNGGKEKLVCDWLTERRSFTNVVTGVVAGAIPQKYLTETKILSINTDAVREDLNNNIPVPGFHLERGTRLAVEI